MAYRSKEDAQAYGKRWRANNRARLKILKKESDHRYWLTHQTEIHIYRRKYYAEHRKEILVRSRGGYLKHHRRWLKEWDKIFIEHRAGECSICNYNKCLDAIDFHHTGEKEKAHLLSWFRSRKPTDTRIKEFEVELMRGIIVCSNCHREIHSQRRKLDESI